MQLAFKSRDFRSRAVSPFLELGAYEAMWLREGASFKSLAEQFDANEGAVPSDFVPQNEAIDCAARVLDLMKQAGLQHWGVRVHGAGEYPQKLRDARHPVELLYYSGWWDLVETRCVAVVGTRNPSPEGLARTRKLSRCLVDDGYTVVSGLARGVDTAAHEAAIKHGGKTIAVLGTPLTHNYPKENASLQQRLAEDFLLISQVPVLRYMKSRNPRSNAFFFPERNVTMSALTMATVIVEAGETSGTLHQARAAFQQGRKLFILDSCFERGLSWPERLQKQGAIRVSDYSDIQAALMKS